jgi:hypothetical protein
VIVAAEERAQEEMTLDKEIDDGVLSTNPLDASGIGDENVDLSLVNHTRVNMCK